MTEEVKESVIRNPQYVNAEGTLIDVEKFNKELGWIPMTLSREAYPEFWDDAMRQIPLSFDKPTEEEAKAEAAREIRSKRDFILTTEVDPIVSNPLRWADLNDADRHAYTVYRKALLDLSNQTQFPDKVQWPVLVLSTR